MSLVPSVVANLATQTLWRRGELSDLLLDQTQQEIHDFVVHNPSLQIYILAARQLGKSFACLTLACEICLKNPHGRVNYVGKTSISIKGIVETSMKIIVESAPDDCKPVFHHQKSRWVFPNGAFIQLLGADEDRGADRLRGPRVVANFIDEAAFIDCIAYLVNDVLRPMARRSRAKTILLTTPAHSPGHDSCDIEDAAAASNALITRTIWAPGMQSREEKIQFLTQEAAVLNMTLEEYMLTSHFRREYLVERVIEESLAIVPEFPKVKDTIICEPARPPFFDLYVSCDPGMSDFTGILFAYRDFLRAKTVVEHELLLTHQENTKAIADAVKAVLLAQYPYKHPLDSWVFKSPNTEDRRCQAPYSAVVDDTSKRLSADFYSDHGLNFTPALKDNSEAAINQMRLAVGSRELEIHPRCVHLIRQLGNAVRTKPGGDMARTKRDGHQDLVAALKYLVRSVSKTHNPFPIDWNFDHQNKARRDEPKQASSLALVLFGNTHLGRRLKGR